MCSWRRHHRVLKVLRDSVGLSARIASGSADQVLLPQIDETEQVGTFLQAAVEAWLNAEWQVEMEAHAIIGSRVRVIYSERRTGLQLLEDLLMLLGTQLEVQEPDAFGESFTGSWEVANKVCDLLSAYMRRDLASGVLDEATSEALRTALPERMREWEAACKTCKG